MVSGNFAGHNASNGLTVGAVSRVRVEDNFLRATPRAASSCSTCTARYRQQPGRRQRRGIDLERGQLGSADNGLAEQSDEPEHVRRTRRADGANHNVLQGNTADTNQGAPGQGGGFIIASAKGNTLRTNVAIGNLDVGIGVFADKPGDAKRNVLAGNFVTNNQAHGIDAVAGTVEVAEHRSRQHPPPQCLGVVCKSA